VSWPQSFACRVGPALVCFACSLCLTAQAPRSVVAYHLEPAMRLFRLDSNKITLIEKLNRADRAHLNRLSQLIVPDRWDLDERAYSPMPQSIPRLTGIPKILVVDVPTQVFGAYEFGNLVRWGPVSSGAKAHQTPPGLYHLNWNARVRISSKNDAWVMPWYFNFCSETGLGLHQYTLPGRPASHGCVRLLVDDAKWLFQWGEGWILTPDREVLQDGTAVLIVGSYDFAGGRPWLQPWWLARGVTLPAEVITSLR
jgi:hypothetical protein